MASANDFRRSYERAAERTKAWDATHPRAVIVEYRPAERRVHVELSNGALFAFPVDDVQGLGGASDRDLAAVRISPSGHALHWPRLDNHILLDPLMRGVLGTREWMSEIGQKGGRVISERKAEAARINGARGGRPRKHGGRRR
ncbi:MAG: DUF2442 domain-containing protein [Gemmatimonadetes bacterium]|nr:DUF2442 domain-containing protein [Gemmatimonadota bacterium]